MKNKAYILDPLKFGVSIGTAVTAATIGVTLIILENWIEGTILLVIAMAFSYEMTIYGKHICINEYEVLMKSFFGKTLLAFSWDEIKEIGVAGTKLFPKADTDRRGTLYIYVSRTEMTDDQRFEMMIQFPPKDMIVLSFDKDRLASFQTRYSEKIRKYNTGSANLLLED